MLAEALLWVTDSQRVIFALLAGTTLLAVWRMIVARLITHAALFMALSFTSVAGIFLLFQSEFIAAIQVLVYAGAITTMVLFAIMLSEIKEVRGTEASRVQLWIRSGPVAFAAGGSFAAFMIYLYIAAGLPDAQMSFGPIGAREVGRELFTIFVVPFELASVLLLVAVIGAIILTQQQEADK
jgi:NADH-quinone oxidoreductase subunit J